MERMLTCTWAPTVLDVPKLVEGTGSGLREAMTAASGADLEPLVLAPVRQAEEMGIDHLLVPQRWWGSGDEIEGSSLDALAMTAFYAAQTERIHLITAIHPGFFLPAAIAKWGATIDRLTGGRWSINVTSGWHLAEFPMYGADPVAHDERYARSSEFIEVLRGAWANEVFDYEGRFYRVEGLRLEPRPLSAELQVFQGGQSRAGVEMAALHSDWMFMNGGRTRKIGGIIERVRKRAAECGRNVRFALYAIPLCRETDAQAEAEVAAMVDALDPVVAERRSRAVAGAEGMWSSQGDPLSLLDTNEGFASRLIGSPDTILRRIREFQEVGVELLHVTLHDPLFNREVLPALQQGPGAA